MMAPIRTGIIGFGLAGSVFHGPLLAADPAYRIDAIVTADPARMSAAARKHPGARILPTPAELWESAGRLDLVVIATATPSHVALADAAIQAGLNVVIDKPFAVTRADGERLIASAARAGVALTVFQEVYGEFETRRPGAVNDDDSFLALRHVSGVMSHLWMSSLVA